MAGLTFDFWDALLLCGIIQGLVILILVNLGSPLSKPGSYFLSATILIFTLHNTLILFRDIHLSEVFPFVKNLPLNLILGFGPCIYFYVLFALLPNSKAKPMVHFVPVVLQFCYYLLLTIDPGLHLNYSAWKVISLTEQLGSLASVCVYTFMSLRLINSYQQDIPRSEMTVKAKALRWLKTLLWSYAILWFVWLLYTLADVLYYDYRLTLRDYFPLYLLVAVLTYWIGIKSYLYPITLSDTDDNKSFRSLKEDEIQQTLMALQEVMSTRKLYFDPELSLKVVAVHTGFNANIISSVLNNRLNQSFNEWVNSYRVDEVKRLLISNRIRELTITGIAFECGFNSKATFNRAFKQQTGVTPSEYLANSKK